MAKVEVKGLKELGEAMRGLSEDINRKIARAATNAAAQVVRKAAQSNVVSLGLVDTGNMKAAIRVVRAQRTRLTSEHRVGVRGGGGLRSGDIKGGKTSDVKAAKAGRGALGKDAFYWRFLELGTVKRPGTPFMQPALAQNKEQAIKAMKDRIKARIDKANKR